MNSILDNDIHNYRTANKMSRHGLILPSLDKYPISSCIVTESVVRSIFLRSFGLYKKRYRYPLFILSLLGFNFAFRGLKILSFSSFYIE